MDAQRESGRDAAAVLQPPMAEDLQLSEPRLPHDILASALALFTWVATGSLVQAIATGLGDHPVRRLVIGVFLLAGSAWMYWRRDVVTTLLRARPSLVLGLATTELTLAAVDGVVGGAYVAFSLTAVGIATIVARPRTVWLCVALLEVEYAAAVLMGHSPASLASDGALGATLGAMASYPVAALLFMWLRGRFTRFVARVGPTLDDIRAGAQAFTPALGSALGTMPLALPAAPVQLTPTERSVVEGLAAGRAAKELAHTRGVSVATIRTHIKNAKRKTGARTLRELATLPAGTDWAQDTDHGR